MPQMPGPQPSLWPALLLRLSMLHRLTEPETVDVCGLLGAGPGRPKGVWDHTQSVWADELGHVPSRPVCASSFLRPPAPTPAQQGTFSLGTSLLLKDLPVASSHPQEASNQYLNWSSPSLVPKHRVQAPPICPQTPMLGSMLQGNRETRREDVCCAGHLVQAGQQQGGASSCLLVITEALVSTSLSLLPTRGNLSILIEKSQVCAKENGKDVNFQRAGHGKDRGSKLEGQQAKTRRRGGERSPAAPRVPSLSSAISSLKRVKHRVPVPGARGPAFPPCSHHLSLLGFRQVS